MKKKYDSEENQRECPICGAILKSPQGLIGHLRFAHQVSANPGQISPADNPRLGIPELKGEVEKLKLEKERDQLLVGKTDKPIPDVSEAAGLGKLTEDIKGILQGRAFNTQPQQPGVIDQVKGLAEAATAIKMAFGGNDSKQGDPTLALLKLLGFQDLRQLFQSISGPKMGAGFEVGGVSLAGAQITPDVAIALLKLQGEKETSAAQIKVAEERNALFEGAIKRFGGAIAEAIGKGAAGIGQGAARGTTGISSKKGHLEAALGEEGEVDCPGCGNPVFIAPDATQAQCECGVVIDIKRQAGKVEPGSVGDHIKKPEGS